MSAGLAYNVLTEFRFEIGSAMLGSQQLAGAVDKISAAADNTLFSFQKLGMGIVASMGLGTGGLLGAMGLALQVSDKFAQSQRDIANIITSNTGDTLTWAQALINAENTMQNINKKAQEFSLSTTDLMTTTKQIGAVLLSHGLDDTSLGKSVDISRQFLKSAPTLGVDPQESQQQLVRAVMGNASGNDTLFNRLTGETIAGSPFGGKGGTQKFNALDPAKRLEVLTNALGQFSKNVNYTKGNALSLSGEMRILGENIRGQFSILRSFGDVLMIPVKQVLHGINTYLQGPGKQIIDSFSKMLSKSMENPRQILASLMQASSLKADISITGKLFGIIGGFNLLFHALKFLGMAIPSMTSVLITFAGSVAVAGGVVAGLAYMLSGVFMFVARLIPQLAIMLVIFQLISRAIAYAKISDAEDMLELAPKMAETTRLFKVAFQGIFDMFDELALLIAPLFKVSIYARAANWALNGLAYGLIVIRATIEGINSLLWQIIMQFNHFIVGGGIDWGSIASSFNRGFDKVMAEAYGGVQSGDSIVKNVTNIGKVEIKNQFKENMEPDRIAFSLTKQLAKVAQNPGQSNGRTMTQVAGANS